MPLINWEASLIVTRSADCVICKVDRTKTFEITDTQLCLQIVLLSTQNNTKLLQQLKSRFKHAINWIKYQSKELRQAQNQYLDYLKIDPSFQGVNRFDLILLSFEDNVVRTGQTEYFLLKVEIKNNNVIKNNQKIYENIEKTASGQ